MKKSLSIFAIFLSAGVLCFCAPETVEDPFRGNDEPGLSLLSSSSGLLLLSSSSGWHSGDGLYSSSVDQAIVDYCNGSERICFHVIYRDFPADMYGFEMFDQAYGNPRQCAEEVPGNPSKNNDNTPENRICFSGSIYHSCDRGGTTLSYDAENCNDNAKRGYKNGPDAAIMGGCWFNNQGQPVFVTRGMVQKRLDYSQCGGVNGPWLGGEFEAQRGRLCARPIPANGKCYGQNLQEWFTDGGYAKRINDILELQRVGNSYSYMANYDYNTRTDWGAGYVTRGFFPLDRFEKVSGKTWGRENYDKWCDGGPCTGGEDHEKHNYGFTMAGFAEFKYDVFSNDMFKFIGDGDMWIFIDGDLFEDPETGAHADLGGVHLPAPAIIDIRRYGLQKAWLDGSKHVINFFYVERQTDGSNFMLQASFSNLF